MNVNELSQEQLNELKSTYFYDVKNDYNYAEEIPNEVIFDYYSGISFVNDDFACTVTQS